MLVYRVARKAIEDSLISFVAAPRAFETGGAAAERSVIQCFGLDEMEAVTKDYAVPVCRPFNGLGKQNEKSRSIGGWLREIGR